MSQVTLDRDQLHEQCRKKTWEKRGILWEKEGDERRYEVGRFSSKNIIQNGEIAKK